MKKKIVILSGGMDSTTLLYDVVNQFDAKNVSAITFDYGSRHAVPEIRAAKKTCEKLAVNHRIFDLREIFKHFDSALLKKDDSEPIPEGHYANENMKKTVVPFRNGILLSLAVGFAESEKADIVYYGAHLGDHQVYPDCRRDFVAAMNMAATVGTYNNVSILAPYKDGNKINILKRGLELKVDYSLTWTCYNPQGDIRNPEPCGKCGSCVERTEAFEQNGYKDPLYTDEKWIEAIRYMKEVSKK